MCEYLLSGFEISIIFFFLPLSILEAHVVGRKLVHILSFIAMVVPSILLFKLST